ncbi:MAG: TlpA family protein disulfide reductase [Anaerolineales bacterium]|nr:TlpA family protein disulfide reductase [Anaerolineales bacterium]
MTNTLKIWTVLLMGVLLLAACGGGAEPAASNAGSAAGAAVSSDNAMTNETAEDMMAEDDAMMDETSDDMMAEDDMVEDDMAEDDMADDDMADEAMAEHDDEMMADDDMADEAMAEHDDEMMADDDEMMAEDDAMMDESADEMMADDMRPAWQHISLTDARSGETFTLADFAGQTVFVEPMATWCSNCRRQLGNVSAARAQLADDNVVFIGLSVETNIDDAVLAGYQAAEGFDWTFAVATPELLEGLVAQFGRTVINPPSTPHFIIRPDGSTTELVTGYESPEELIASLQAAQ